MVVSWLQITVGPCDTPQHPEGQKSSGLGGNLLKKIKRKDQSMFGYRRELRKYEEVDEDELLASLSLEEIQELEQEMDDLDPDTNIPIGLRQRDQTVKTPEGVFNREALLKYWEEENKKLIREEREDAKPSQKESQDKSSLWGELEMINTNKSTPKDYEKKRVTQKAKKVPAQSGFTQDDNKFTNTNIKSKVTSRPKSDTKKPELDQPNGNPIVIDQALEQILNNDPVLIEVNLNNKEEISQEILQRFTEALCTNTHVRFFSLANTHANDRVAFAIAKMLRENSMIRNLNIESNFVSGQGILAILGALQQNRTLIELRFHNQRHICGGKVEMEMVQMLRENTSLLKLGYQFELPGPRMAATSILTRNQDQQRQKRLEEKKKLNDLEMAEQVTSPAVENRTQRKTTELAKNAMTSQKQEVRAKNGTTSQKQEVRAKNGTTSQKQEVQAKTAKPSQNQEVPSKNGTSSQKQEVLAKNAKPSQNQEVPAKNSTSSQKQEVPAKNAKPSQNQEVLAKNAKPSQNQEVPAKNSTSSQKQEVPAKNAKPSQNQEVLAKNGTTPQNQEVPTRNGTTPQNQEVRTKNGTTSQNQEVPTRKIAEMVRQQEVYNKTQTKKLKTKKQKNGANEKEGVDILKELRNSLKPSVKPRDEVAKLPPPQRSGRDDLMAAIRGTSIFSLKRVDLSQT